MRSALAALVILVAWSAVDAVAHRLLLEPLYASSARLWRRPAEMSTTLIIAATLILVLVFVATYAALIQPRSLGSAVLLGGLLGLALGTASGLGTYIHSPIPAALAAGWFALGVLKGLLAGVVLGLLVT